MSLRRFVLVFIVRADNRTDLGDRTRFTLMVSIKQKLIRSRTRRCSCSKQQL